jgi:hypothetical protein
MIHPNPIGLATRACFATFVAVLLTAVVAVLSPLRAEDAASSEQRLLGAARYLASDELEGRGIGTKGLDLAAEYIANEFRQIGLKTELFEGTPFQKFEMTTGAELGKNNHVALVGPASADNSRQELKLGDNYTPLALGGSGKLDHPLVFVGYGITAKSDGYDDYSGVDVKDKVVIALRHEPQQDNPHSAFNGTKNSPHAPFVRKISNAYEHGAAGIIFVTDDFDIRRAVGDRNKFLQSVIDKLSEVSAEFKKIDQPSLAQIDEHRKKVEDLASQLKNQSEKLAAEFDPLLKFDVAGSDNSGRDFPVLYLRRSALDPVVKAATGQNLAALERAIDKCPAPQSRQLAGWRIQGEVSVNRTEAQVKNVVAVLEGQGELKDETIIIGAHYDHVGRGGPGSGAIDPNNREIHNGADDNGSGTATLLEVARQLAASDANPRRRIVFIAFTGEERGLLGSSHYTRSPLYKLEDTVAMLNMDMVGRLTDDKLVVEGVGTATEFTPLVDRVNEKYGFQLTKKPGGFGPSDHAAFYAKKLPVMHFFTGTHKDYHRPSDDYDKLNVSGMRRIGQLVAEIGLELAQAPERPSYQETQNPHGAGGGGGGGDRPYFGSIPDFTQDQPGYALTGVTKGSPAEKAGLKAGDIIVGLGESKIGNLEDFDSALRKYKAGDRVPITVKRAGQEQKFEVTLEPPR